MRGETQKQKPGTTIREKILRSASYKAAALGQKLPYSTPPTPKVGKSAQIIVGASYRAKIRASFEYKTKAALAAQEALRNPQLLKICAYGGGQMDNTMLGCQYVTQETFEGIISRCHKITAEGTILCPKHILIAEDDAKKQERIAEKLAALIASPLAVIPKDELPMGFEAPK